MVLRAISLRNSRNAVSKLRILWRQRYFTHFYLVIRGTPSRNSGFRVAHGILRNFVEKCEKRRLQTLDFALPLIFRATPLRYEKCRSQTVDSSLSIVFRAISWRNTRNAAAKLRISRCQRYFTQFDGELRGSPSPNCGFQVANRISRNFIEMQGMRSSICGFRVINNISRNFIEIRETPSPNCGFRVANGTLRNFGEKYEKCRLQSADSSLSIVFRASSLGNTRNAVSKLRISRCP